MEAITIPAVDTLLPFSGAGFGVGEIEAAALLVADIVEAVVFELSEVELMLEEEDEVEADRVEVDNVVLVEDLLLEVFCVLVEDAALLEGELEVAAELLGSSDVVAAGCSEVVTTGVTIMLDVVVGCTATDVLGVSDAASVEVDSAADDVSVLPSPEVNGSSRLSTPLTRGSRNDMFARKMRTNASESGSHCPVYCSYP